MNWMSFPWAVLAAACFVAAVFMWSFFHTDHLLDIALEELEDAEHRIHHLVEAVHQAEDELLAERRATDNATWAGFLWKAETVKLQGDLDDAHKRIRELEQARGSADVIAMDRHPAGRARP